MMPYPQKDWPYTTYFEDEILPGQALTLDAATMYDHHPEYDEEESLWFWKFTICVGRIRSDDSRNILIHSKNLLAKVLRYEENVIAKRKELEPDTDPYIIYNQWVESLKKIILAAQNKNYCFWISGYSDDYEFLQKWRQNALLPTNHHEYKPPPHIQDVDMKIEEATKRLVKAERIFEARRNKEKKRRIR